MKQLAEYMECSRQTVLRLMEEVELTGMLKVKMWREGGQNWYRAKVPVPRPNVSFSQSELQQLLLCRDFVCHLLPKGHQHLLSVASAKAICFLPDGQPDGQDTSQLQGQSAVKGFVDYTPQEHILNVLLNACGKLQVTEIAYKALHHTETRIHAFVPVRFVAYHDGLYVRGWRITEKGTPEILSPMMLAIHRMQEIWLTRRSLSQEMYDARPFPPEAAYFGMAAQSAPFTVRIRFFHLAAAYIRERQWSANQRIEDEADGSCVLHFIAQSEMEVVKWTLSFGQDAELIFPVHLRKQVAQELAVAAGRYV